MTTPAQNIAAIRRQMTEKGLAAYLIPATDPHISEYLPDHWKTLAWASGFTGSAGTLVVTHSFAGVWTDSRYFIQAEQQLAGSGIELVKLVVPHTTEFVGWMASTLPEGSIVGFDGNLVSRSVYQSLEAGLRPRGIRLDPNTDLAGPIWANRPPLPENPVFEHPIKFAGASRPEKLARVRQRLTEKKVTHTVLSSLDDIAWVFNLRGNDVPYNPVFVAHAVIGLKDAALFVSLAKVSDPLRRKLNRDGIKVFPYEAITAYLSKLPAHAFVLLDPKRVSQNLPGALSPTVKVLDDVNITTWLKACKTPEEVEQTRQTMVRDGVALTKFFYWLAQNVGKQKITERSAQGKLHEIRLKQPNCVGESFGTISAYGPHAAMPHYSATPESDVELRPEGLYLLDSGGQYLGGTTDTTRVMSLGNITDEQMTDYTLVLKGLIAISRLRYPRGTRGYQVDILARLPQWERGINFGHGTGHGVGYYLCVHEGPQGISPNPVDTPLLPGMITSVEPGIYRPGKHGVRIENLVVCTENEKTEFGEFLAFETLTLAPIFTNLVKKSLLSKEDITWLRAYNVNVAKKLARYLSKEEKVWLRAACRI